MDKVFVKGLMVDAAIGADEWEKTVRQPLIIEIEVLCDNSRAAITDDVNDLPVNYSHMAGRVREFVGAKRFALIEALAESLAADLLGQFDIPWIRLSIEKPRPSGYSAALIIERSSHHGEAPRHPGEAPRHPGESRGPSGPMNVV